MNLVDRKIIIYLALLLMVLMAWSCAQIGTPGGGLDDETAPYIIREGSTTNSQTNFTDRRIELIFNEWITTSNTTKEVFISPPLDYPLQITDRGKKVIVEFNEKEVLKENTTYQISFGKAIKDLTAGNVLENYTFLFSTGDKLDYLSIEGTVVDFVTQQPVKDVIVLLHASESDTSFTQAKPTYLTRTEDDGSFKLKNLRADTFQIFGLVDGNVSYTYDLQSEQVAFLDSTLILIDSMPPMQGITLELFDEEDEALLIESRQKQQGLVKLLYKPKVRNPQHRILNAPEAESFLEFSKDTLLLWHKLPDTLNLVITHDDAIDTMKIRAAKNSIAELSMLATAKPLNQFATDSIMIEWNKPIASIDTSKIVLSDTVQDYPFTAGYYDKTLWLLADLAANASYNITIDSAAVVDWYGVESKDSVAVSLRTLDLEELGQINLSITKEDSISYVLELRTTENLIEKWTIFEPTEIVVPNLLPGTYKINLLQDLNGDGRWSSGNLSEKKKPEIRKEKTLESLKSGWELETTIDITELFYGT